MKLATWFSMMVISAVLVCGCASGGGEAAPEDKDFQNSLATAAAKAKESGAPKSTRGKLPPEVTSKMGAPPAADTKAPGSAPAAGTK